jgi:hypothetical protein
MAPPPTKIMIIRHAEKPPNPPNTTGPWDVLANGQSGNGESLIVPGWQRAGALNAFFAPYQASPSNSEIATPDYIYAANPDGETQRPWETVTPLAAWLKYESNTPQFNVAFNIGVVYEFDTQGETDFLVLEYVGGTSLASQLTSGALPEKEAVKLGQQVAAALFADISDDERDELLEYLAWYRSYLTTCPPARTGRKTE